MIKLNGLQELVAIEINKLVDDLREINSHINSPYPPMTHFAQKEHDEYISTIFQNESFFTSLPCKQSKLTEKIEKWSQALTESID